MVSPRALRALHARSERRTGPARRRIDHAPGNCASAAKRRLLGRAERGDTGTARHWRLGPISRDAGNMLERLCEERYKQRGADMKVNIEIDCTPLEARQFIGLPDLAPMQTAVMDKLQQQVLSNIDKVSPESLIQSWFTFDPKLAERFQDMFVTMAGLGGTRSGDKKK